MEEEQETVKYQKYFESGFLDLCKNNPNQPQFIPSDVKIVYLKIAMYKWLYAQVVMIRRKDLNN